MKNGYNPGIPSTNPNMPDWARFTVDADQIRLDAQYMHGSGNSLDHYYAMCDAWKEAETKARDASPDPDHYSPVTPFPTIPARQIEDFDNDKGFVFRSEVDPTISNPTLDPYVKPVTYPNGISTTGAQKQQEIILNMLAQLVKDTSAIKAHLGI